MREVTSKTGGTKSTVVSGDVVTMQHTTYHKASDSHFALTTTFDFEGVGRDDIVRLAAECLLIRWRTAFKNADAVSDKDDHQVVSVAKMLSKSRAHLTPQQKVAKVVGKLTTEQRAALLQALQADDDGE